MDNVFWFLTLMVAAIAIGAALDGWADRSTPHKLDRNWHTMIVEQIKGPNGDRLMLSCPAHPNFVAIADRKADVKIAAQIHREMTL